MNRQPKATPIKRLFEQNRIADYSHSTSKKVIAVKDSEQSSQSGKNNENWKSANFDLDEIENKRYGPVWSKGAIPKKNKQTSLYQVLSQQKSK